MKKKVVIEICLLFFLIMSLTGCQVDNRNNMNEKLNSELGYIEDLIFKIVNKYAKKEYEEDKKTNWKYIKDDIEKINNSLSTLIIDLTKIDVPNEDIVGFSNDINNLLLSANDESDIAMLESLNEMYKKIVKFREKYMENKNQVEKYKIKSQILNNYFLANKNDYVTAKSDVLQIVENYKKLMNNKEYKEENLYDLDKIYVLLEEYSNSIKTEKIDLIRMKYIGIIEEI